MQVNEPYQLISTIEGSGIGEVINLECSRDGSTLYAGGTGTSVSVIDAHQGKMMKSIKTDSLSNFGIFTMPNLFDDYVFVAGKHSNELAVYSISEEKSVANLRIRAKGVWIAEPDPNRNRVALLGIDGEILCYEIRENLTLSLLFIEKPLNPNNTFECLTYSHDGSHCVASGAHGRISLYDSGSWERIKDVKLTSNFVMFCQAATSTPVGIATDTEGRMWSFNTDTLDVISSVPATGVPFRDVVMSQDGRIVATLSVAHTVVLFKTDGLIPILAIPADGEVFSLQMDKQAGRLFVGATHSKIRVYDLNQARRKILFVFYSLRDRPDSFPLLQKLRFSLRRELINYLEQRRDDLHL